MKYSIFMIICGVSLLQILSCWGPIDPDDKNEEISSYISYKDSLGLKFLTDIDSAFVAGIPMNIYIGATSFIGTDSVGAFYLSSDSSVAGIASTSCSLNTDTIINVGEITFNRSGDIALYFYVSYTDSNELEIFDTVNLFVQGNSPEVTINGDSIMEFTINELDTLKLVLDLKPGYLHSKPGIVNVVNLPLGASFDTTSLLIYYIPDTSVASGNISKVQAPIGIIVIDSSIPPVVDTAYCTISVLDSITEKENSKPTFKDSLPLYSFIIDEGDSLKIAFMAEDADSDYVSYFLTNSTLPSIPMLDTTNKLITWLSGLNDSGSYSLTINATDFKDTTSVIISIGVGNVNLAPKVQINQFVEGDTVYVKEGTTLIFQVTATDVNVGDSTILMSLDSVPWANSVVGEGYYDTVSGNFSFLPYITAVDSIDSILVLGSYSFCAVDNAIPPLKGSLNLFIAVVDSPIVTQKIAPKIISSPSSTVALEGDTASFSVIATGSDLKYQWICNDTNVTGAINATIKIYAITVNDSGNIYKCQVYNSDSSVYSDEAVLSVLPVSPIIDTHPQTYIGFIGDSAIFKVSAQGSKLQYQWYKNDVIIPAETLNVFKIDSLSYTDSGSTIKCKVFNSGGELYSNNAELTVNNPKTEFINLVDTLKLSINDTVNVTFVIKDNQNIKAISWIDGSGPHLLSFDEGNDSLNVDLTYISGASTGSILSEIVVTDYLDCNSTDTICLVVTDEKPVFKIDLPDTVHIGWGDSVHLSVKAIDDGDTLSYSWKFDFTGYKPSASGDTSFVISDVMPFNKLVKVRVDDLDGNFILDSVIISGDFELIAKTSNFLFKHAYGLNERNSEWYLMAETTPNPHNNAPWVFMLLKTTDFYNWTEVPNLGSNWSPIGFNDKYFLQVTHSAPIGEFSYSEDMVNLNTVNPTPPFTFSQKSPEMLSIGNTSYLFADSGLYVVDPDNTADQVLRVSDSPIDSTYAKVMPNCKNDSIIYFIDEKKLFKLRESSSMPYSFVHEMNIDPILVGDIYMEEGVLWLVTSDYIKCSKDLGISWVSVSNTVPWASDIAFIQLAKNGDELIVITSDIVNGKVYKYSGKLTCP